MKTLCRLLLKQLQPKFINFPICLVLICRCHKRGCEVKSARCLSGAGGTPSSPFLLPLAEPQTQGSFALSLGRSYRGAGGVAFPRENTCPTDCMVLRRCRAGVAKPPSPRGGGCASSFPRGAAEDESPPCRLLWASLALRKPGICFSNIIKYYGSASRSLSGHR